MVMKLLTNISSKLPLKLCSRPFYGWLNNVANKVDISRIEEVGPDRAAAEWLLKCGAKVKFAGSSSFEGDYNSLVSSGRSKQIVEIDGTDSTIFSVGFPYLKGLKSVEKVTIKRNPYLDDEALPMLELINDSLRTLELLTIANVTDKGVRSLVVLTKLKKLVLFNLPSVKSRSECLEHLQANLPNCDVDWPERKASDNESSK